MSTILSYCIADLEVCLTSRNLKALSPGSFSLKLWEQGMKARNSITYTVFALLCIEFEILRCPTLKYKVVGVVYYIYKDNIRIYI